MPELHGLDREDIAARILAVVAAAGIPAPSLLVDSGRGFYCVWLVTGAAPAALPRWRAVMRALVGWARPLGADPACVDPARVLRLPGSWHEAAGRQVTVLCGDGGRHPFDLLADSIWRAAGRPRRRDLEAARERRRTRSIANAESERGRGPRGLSRPAFCRDIRGDLETLLGHWGGAVPVGVRDLWLHIHACALTWTDPQADILDLVLQRAAVVAPGLPSRHVLVITHDLALARRIGGRLIVLRAGQVVEAGPTASVLAAPAAPYTCDLLAADPEFWAPRPAPAATGAAVLRAEGLAVARADRRLVEGLDLALRPGEVLGITGPSGCGKSSLGDALLGLLPPAAGSVVRAEGLAPTALQKLYQDPVAAFPRHRLLARTLADVARLHRAPPGRIEALLTRLRLVPALLTRRPGAVSGGELQRLALLRAMLARPRFLFADEPTSRLAPITQREVINLLLDLARTEGLAIALVSHDAALIDKVADRTLTLEGPRTLPPHQPSPRPQPPRELARTGA